MSTSTAFRFALVTALTTAAAGAAEAKPRRVVVLDFEGKRGVADQGKATVVSVLSADYDMVSSKTWVDAKAAAARKTHGPAAWSKAARATGVDAVVEGWVQDEGRSKVLTLVITDASNGEESDQLSIKLGTGFDVDLAEKVRKGLEDRFEWIDPINGGNPDALPTYKVKEKIKVGARQLKEDETPADDTEEREPPRRRKRADRDADAGDDDRPSRKRDRGDRDRLGDRRDDDVSEKEPVRVAKLEVKETKAEKEQSVLVNVFKNPTEEEDIVTGGKASHVPTPTSKFAVSGGLFYGSRTLYIEADNPEGVTQYAGIPSKGLSVEAAFFPFPTVDAKILSVRLLICWETDPARTGNARTPVPTSRGWVTASRPPPVRQNRMNCGSWSAICSTAPSTTPQAAARMPSRL